MLSEKIILWCLPTAPGFQFVSFLSQFNGGTHKGKASYLLKELEWLKHSWSTKNAAANKVTTNYKKHCQVVRITEKKKKNQKNSRNLASTTNISPTFQFFGCKIESKLLRKSSTFSLLCLTVTYMLVAFKKGNKICCVQAARTIKSKDVAKGQILPLVTPNFFQFFKFCFLVISS